MIIKAKKVRVENGENGAITVFTDSDAEVKSVRLETLNPGERFVEENKLFAVLAHRSNGTEVIEVGELERRKFDDDCNNWGASDLRNYLNIDVLHSYEKMFGAENIIEDETDLTSLDGLTDYGICTDKIRLMTFEERRKYQHLYEREEMWEWLVTPWSTKQRGVEYAVCCVSAGGSVSDDVCYGVCAVRPFCILKSNIFVSKEEK